MNLISKLFLIVSSIIIVLCIPLGIFLGYLKFINDSLDSTSNIFSYLGMLFAASALLVACLAFSASIARPNLSLSIWSRMDTENEITLCTNRNDKIVPIGGRNTSLYFRLDNKGKVSAKNPVVEIIFKEAFYEAAEFPGWEAIYHEKACGYYGFRWSSYSDSLIYPGLPILLPTMYFTGKTVDKPLVLNIKIVADGFGKKSYDIPINVRYVDYM